MVLHMLAQSDRNVGGCGFRVLAVAGSLLVGAGCATTPADQPITPASASANARLDFVRSAAVGESKLIGDGSPDGGVKVQVTRAYEAASGHSCREYTLSSEGGKPEQHLACGGARGWADVKPLLASDSPVREGR